MGGKLDLRRRVEVERWRMEKTLQRSARQVVVLFFCGVQIETGVWSWESSYTLKPDRAFFGHPVAWWQLMVCHGHRMSLVANSDSSA